MFRRLFVILIVASVSAANATAAEPLKVGTFHVDATPPLGSPLCDGLCPPAKEIVDRLSARGVVLVGDEQPIVLCAVDWVGIGNGGYGAWRRALAKAAGTSESRVAVHCLHQHDAPGCDFDAEELLAAQGLAGAAFHVAFARDTIDRASAAVREAVATAEPVTHLGLGIGRVEQVASNRRILGPDGKVQFVRYSSCKDEKIRAAPEGVIDPDVRLVSFFNGDRPLVSITYYATHPQSYYGQGGLSADFVGMARALREKEQPNVAHIHFDGAGGNVAAGKYNDGTPGMRPVLAERLAAGMRGAWENMKRVPIAAADVRWRSTNVVLPASPGLDAERLAALVADSSASPRERIGAARHLVWLRRCRMNDPIELTCLRLGPAWVLHMPGELFVEYQLAAEKMRPEAVVCMAAYGDYGPGYIGTEVAYPQGGYETGAVSRVAPAVERVLMEAMREVLAVPVSTSGDDIHVSEDFERITLATPDLEAVVRKKGYVSGVAAGTLLDKKTGFRDAGFGLDIVDWIMEPGSDEAYRDQLPKEMVYQFGNGYHGNIPKRSIEGPQICTQAKELAPDVVRGRDFVAVKQSFHYLTAAPGKKTGSLWTQTLVFPKGKRYFISSDWIDAVNDSPAMFLRVDMPGHIKHRQGDTFSEVYLSYVGTIPAKEFANDFAPDEKFTYRRDDAKTPQRMIRGYHLRDAKSGKAGPWLAGMTLNAADVSEAWCHQRGYVCMIEEFGGRPIKSGGSFSAAFVVGYFDSIDEMEKVYDQYAGHSGLKVTSAGWELTK